MFDDNSNSSCVPNKCIAKSFSYFLLSFKELATFSSSYSRLCTVHNIKAKTSFQHKLNFETDFFIIKIMCHR